MLNLKILYFYQKKNLLFDNKNHKYYFIINNIFSLLFKNSK
jgi:hypothetical protein